MRNLASKTAVKLCKKKSPEATHRTTYFAFPDVKSILNDLHSMEPKVLGGVEQNLLKNDIGEPFCKAISPATDSRVM